MDARLDHGPFVEADDLLIAVAASRDRGAFARLFELCAPRVRRLLLSRGTSPGDADDLTQEVMLTVWRKADLFDRTRGAALSWILAITRNCLLNHLRGQRYPVLDLDDPEAPLSAARALSADVVAADQELARAEEARAVGIALGTLPTQQREVLRGTYFEERTLRDLADEQRIPLGTVKTRVRLGLQRLRQLLRVGQKK